MANPKPFASALVGVSDLNDLVSIYDRSTADVDVNTSTSETSLYSKSIGASAMSSTWMLVCYVEGDMLQNAAGNFTIRVKFGATTLWTGTSNVALNATRRNWFAEFRLANDNASNAQRLQGNFRLGPLLTDTAISALTLDSTLYGTATEDTTGAKTLDVTVQWSASSASLSWTKKYAQLWLA